MAESNTRCIISEFGGKHAMRSDLQLHTKSEHRGLDYSKNSTSEVLAKVTDEKTCPADRFGFNFGDCLWR